MPPSRDFDETVKARAQRDLEFRETLLSQAAEALLRGPTDRGPHLADLVSATNHELAEHLEDAEDRAVLRRRLKDAASSDFIPDAKIGADIRQQED